jgi:hypothetical protein
MATSKLSRIFDYVGPTADLQSPVWTLRLCPSIALVCILLAETVWKSGFAHGLCFGIAAGQLAMLCIISFQITSVTMHNPPQNSDLQELHLTR